MDRKNAHQKNPSSEGFSAQSELETVKEFRKAIRKPSYHRSRLRKYRYELVALRQEGASYKDLCIWLRLNKRVVVHHTTVMRFLKRLPELAHDAL